MKRFLRKTLTFLIIPTIIGSSIFTLFVIWITNLSSEYQLKSDIRNIYIGDSHIEKAINDSIMPNSLNLGTTSESFYFSYYKLKLLLNNNPHVKKVYLGFSYHNLSNYYEKFISGDYSVIIAPKYFYILPPKEQFKMVYWNKKKLISFIKTTIEKRFTKLKILEVVFTVSISSVNKKVHVDILIQ